MKEIMTVLIEKFKKNSKLSVADKDTFERELAIGLSNGKYTEEIETVLCEGPIDSTMKILAQFLFHSEVERANPFIKKFLFCKRMEENKGGTSGMRVVALFSYAVGEYKEQNPIIEMIFKEMIKFAYKNGKDETNKKVVDLIRAYVLPLFEVDKFIINLSFLSNDYTWYKTRELFVEVITKGGTNIEVVQKVFYWLKESGKEMGNCTEEFLIDKVLKKNDSIKKEIEEDNSNPKCEVVEKNAYLKKADQIDKKITMQEESDINIGISVQEILGTLTEILLTETKEMASIKSELDYTKRKIDELYMQLNRAHAKEKEQNESIEKLIFDKKTLQGENISNTTKINELEKMVGKLNREIDDRKQFTDTVTRNREKQSEEHLNRLASKLKIDYRDFCDAKNLDMTVDLGENMREQLGAIFAILEKSGIKLN